MTDSDAPFMTHKDGIKKPSYNHQTARDGKYGVITAVKSKATVDKP